MGRQKVSIIIPTYNRAALIVRAVQSVLAQAIDGDEVIVIDDGSSDNTQEVLTPFLAKIRYIRTENAGVGAARNRGIQEARNPLVTFLDSDDEWTPNKLMLQRTLMQKRDDILYCFSDFMAIGKNNQIHHQNIRSWNDDDRPWDEIIGPEIPYSHIVPPPGVSDFPVHIEEIYILMECDQVISRHSR